MFQEAEDRVRRLVREEVGSLRKEFEALREECLQYTLECKQELQEQRRWLADTLTRFQASQTEQQLSRLVSRSCDNTEASEAHDQAQSSSTLRQTQQVAGQRVDRAESETATARASRVADGTEATRLAVRPAATSDVSSGGHASASSVGRPASSAPSGAVAEKQQPQRGAAESSSPAAPEQAASTSGVVTLNVGGEVFTTLSSTLRRVPDSFLDIMLSGRHPVARDSSGNIFIDRNSAYFPTILDWLRDPASPHALPFNDAEFLHELEYYGLADAVLGDWTTSEPDTSAVTGGVYVVGSDAPNERYDLDRNIWYPVADMLQPRSECRFIWFNGRLYAIGGSDRQRVYAAVERFDPRKNNWVPVPNMHHARRSVSCVVHNGLLYVAGGLDHNGRGLPYVERYDPDTRVWEELQPMQACSGRVACVTVRGKLFVLGGCEMIADPRSYVPLRSVEMFNEATGAWVARAPMPQPRYELHAAVVRTKIVVVGGLASSSTASALARTDIFDTESNTWETGRDMQLKRFSVACCDTIGTSIYVAGGSNPVALETVERYDLDTDTWTILPNMSQHRHFFAATVFQGRLLTVGGMTYRRDRRSQRVGASMPVTTVEAYDPATNRWHTLAPLNNPRAHGVCVTADTWR